MIFINGKNKVMGRMCSEVAHRLLKSNEKIVIVNSKDTIISGVREKIFDEYHQRTKRKVKGNQERNPKYPRYPDRIVKRCVKNMMPPTPKGKLALGRLRVYIDTPDEFIKDIPKEENFKSINHVTLTEISNFLGAKIK
jgi:large subunit ribosomal protein L13